MRKAAGRTHALHQKRAQPYGRPARAEWSAFAGLSSFVDGDEILRSTREQTSKWLGFQVIKMVRIPGYIDMKETYF
jgi:hypothetical protein